MIGIRVVGRGGKERVALVLNAYKKQMTAIVDKALGASELLFTTYDSHINNHRFRVAYCVALLVSWNRPQGSCGLAVISMHKITFT